MSSSDLQSVLSCPFCFAQVDFSQESMADVTSLICKYCGKEISFASLEIETKETEVEEAVSRLASYDYQVGTWRKRNKIKSLVKTVVLVAVFVAAFSFLGGGKVHSTIFLGVKKRPGIENTFVSLNSTSTYGPSVVTQKIKRHFQYLLVKYDRRQGFVFLKDLDQF